MDLQFDPETLSIFSRQLSVFNPYTPKISQAD